MVAFKDAAEAWFGENTPRDVDFMLPLTFMEVGTDQQFNFLREWQNKVYEAGYLGAHWPKEYGGGGLHPAFQDAATRVMAQMRTPIMLNAIGLNWTGPLLLDRGSEEEKQKYIKGILSAETIWCQGFRSRKTALIWAMHKPAPSKMAMIMSLTAPKLDDAGQLCRLYDFAGAHQS